MPLWQSLTQFSEAIASCSKFSHFPQKWARPLIYWSNLFKIILKKGATGPTDIIPILSLLQGSQRDPWSQPHTGNLEPSWRLGCTEDTYSIFSLITRRLAFSSKLKESLCRVQMMSRRSVGNPPSATKKYMLWPQNVPFQNESWPVDPILCLVGHRPALS